MATITVTKQYVCFIEDGKRVGKTDSLVAGTHPIQDGKTIEETDSKAVYDAWEIEASSTVYYDANTLISWAMAQVFTADLIPHMAAFLDFANKANDAAKANFLAYATAVDLVSTATTIINKAIELGAPITVL